MKLPMRYSPSEEMRRLQREMDEVFESFFQAGRSGRELMAWGPRAPLSDVEDRDDALLVSAELPGMDKDDIKIVVDKDSLTIEAERKGAKEEKEKDYYYCERTYSGFKRVFHLPEEVDPDKVDASYEDGILKVEMKKIKKPELEKKEVKIK